MLVRSEVLYCKGGEVGGKEGGERPLFFLWSADLIGIQCLSLHKSLYWYIRLFSTQDGGPWGCVVWGRLWGTFLFRWGGTRLEVV